jgi:hypothetical protein
MVAPLVPAVPDRLQVCAGAAVAVKLTVWLPLIVTVVLGGVKVNPLLLGVTV